MNVFDEVQMFCWILTWIRLQLKIGLMRAYLPSDSRTNVPDRLDWVCNTCAKYRVTHSKRRFFCQNVFQKHIPQLTCQIETTNKWHLQPFVVEIISQYFHYQKAKCILVHFCPWILWERCYLDKWIEPARPTFVYGLGSAAFLWYSGAVLYPFLRTVIKT